MKITDSNGITWDVKARVWDGTSWVRIGEYVWHRDMWNLIKYWIKNTSLAWHSPTNIRDAITSIASINIEQDPT